MTSLLLFGEWEVAVVLALSFTVVGVEFMLAQMVGAWTHHCKSANTQGARFLLPLGSVGSLLLGFFLSK